MKKTLLALTCCMMHGFLFAQTFAGGIKGGVNITNFSGTDFTDVSKKALVGFHAGGFMNFKMRTLALQPELLVSTGGAKLERNGQTESYKLTYVTVPVMLQFHTPSGFFVEAGPQVGFKISEDIPEESIEDFAKGLDLSVGAGLGYKISGGLGFNVRYLVGLSKVGDFDPDATLDPDFKNSTIQAGIFYMLGNRK